MQTIEDFKTFGCEGETLIFEFLGLPPLLSWIIIGILLLVSSLMIYQRLKFKFSEECRNCGKPTEVKGNMLCNSCYNEYQDIFPKGWKNRK